MQTTILCSCSECGKSFQKLLTYVNRSKTGKHYCTPNCQYIARNKAFVKSRENVRLEYDKNPKLCLCCQTPLDFLRRDYTFCSSKCGATYTQRNGGHGGHIWTDEEKIRQSLIVKNSEKYRKSIENVKRKPIILNKKCPTCGKAFHDYPSGRKLCCSKECAEIRGVGGYREKSGTSKRGWYKGIFCGSSWELAWVIYQLDHGIAFTRNRESFQYEFGGKVRKYYPDFKVGDEYVEIKGYKKPDVDAKVSQFPRDKKLTMLYREQMQPIFDYVFPKYGKHIHTLYGTVAQ